MDEEKFQAWYKEIASITGLNPDPDDINHQYDYRGFYKKYAKDKEGKNISNFKKLMENDPKAHGFTDEFKLPLHPTFSDESIYNNPINGVVGGYWKNDTTFVPSQFNLSVQDSLSFLRGKK